MRKTTLCTLIVLLPLALPTQAQRPFSWPPLPEEYGLFEVADDPWVFSAAAGPAGGWGIAAVPANPASLMAGPSVSLVGGVPWDHFLGVVAVGLAVNDQWRYGLAVRWVPDAARRYTASSGGGPGGVLDAGDVSIALTVAQRIDAVASMGVTAKYLQSTRVRGVLEHLDLWAFDVGFRFDELLPALTIVARESQLLKKTRARWRPGFTIGIATTNFGTAARVTAEGRRIRRLEWRSHLGITYRPLITRTLCVSLNANYARWPAGFVTAPEWIWHLPPGWYPPDAVEEYRWTAGYGVAMEFNEAVEAGIASNGPYRDGRRHWSWFGAIGPPHFRILFTKGANITDGFGSSNERLDRLTVRIILPFESGREERRLRSPHRLKPLR